MGSKQYSREQVAEQCANCYELRLGGFTIRQIAKQTGLSLGTVENRLQKAMRERVGPLAEEYRGIIIDKLERLAAKLEPAVEAGDLKAINTSRQIAIDLLKANGLESVKVVMTTEFDESVNVLLDRMESAEQAKEQV